MIVLLVVEYGTNVVNGQSLLLVEFLLGILLHVVLQQDEIVIECLQTCLSKLLAIGAVFTDAEKELKVRVDGEVLRLDDRFVLLGLVVRALLAHTVVFLLHMLTKV